MDQSSIRAHNLSRILDAMRSEPSITRGQIARHTGLSLMSVSNLVDQLSRQGAIRVKERAGGRGVGRRAECLALDDAPGAWLIIDLSERPFRFCTLSLNRAHGFSGQPWTGDSTRDYIGNLTEFLGTLADHAQRALGVAVVTPGPYDAEADAVRNQRIPEINRIRLKALVGARLGADIIYVDEDVKFAARAHMERMDMRDADILYYLYIGEGVGGAAVHGRQVVRGLNAVAGDAGRLPFEGGSYESALSLGAFAARVLGGDRRDAALSEVLAAADGDPAAYRRAIMDCAAVVAHLLTQVMWLIDPNIIAIDCAYASPMDGVFIDAVRSALAEGMRGTDVLLPEIRGPEAGVQAAYLGAAAMLQSEWIKRINKTGG